VIYAGDPSRLWKIAGFCSSQTLLKALFASRPLSTLPTSIRPILFAELHNQLFRCAGSRKRHAGLLTLCVAAAWLGAMPVPARAGDLVPPDLRELSAKANLQETWPRLRRWAQSQNDPQWSGWAYFLVGYQEYQAHRHVEATQDLAQAAQSSFPLADYAVFYGASSLSQANQAADAAAALVNFAGRFPHSRLHRNALVLRANTLIDAKQPQRAVEELAAYPETHLRPDLLLLFGRALMQAHQLGESAAAFQEVYYRFPVSPQAESAGGLIKSLRIQLGNHFPAPQDELEGKRPEAFFNAGRYDDALKDYRDLLKAAPSSPLVPIWELGLARCLVRLRRSADALQALFTHFALPELEAQRLALLVQLHAQRADTQGMAQVLEQLETSYATSSAYADALASAGIYYYRQLNWQEAARNYRQLFDRFPQNDHVREDGWRLAWCEYLLNDPQAPEVIEKYLKQFPDSPRAPAALYWLGRIEEEHGALSEARALYALLLSRFIHTYYAAQAAARLEANRGSSPGYNDTGAAPLAASLIPVLAPPLVPAGLACLAASPTEAARPALILQSLGLQNLEEEVLRAALGEDHPSVELRLLLTEAYAADNNVVGALFSGMKIAPAYSQMDFPDLPKEVWDFLFPQAYAKLIDSQARLNNLDPYLVMGLVRQESAFSARALSVANAIGLMQVLPETAARSNRPARTRLAARRLYDPAYNVQVGCAYLAELLKEFGGSVERALAAYNAGENRVKDWDKKYTFRDAGTFMESIPIPATRTYVELVLRDAEIYRRLMSGSWRFATCPAVKSIESPSTPLR